jgi:hypothetical protein
MSSYKDVILFGPPIAYQKKTELLTFQFGNLASNKLVTTETPSESKPINTFTKANTQWTPLNGITLGQRENDSKNRLILIRK